MKLQKERDILYGSTRIMLVWIQRHPGTVVDTVMDAYGLSSVNDGAMCFWPPLSHFVRTVLSKVPESVSKIFL